MPTTILAIGTRKGLFLARSADRRTWDVGPMQFPMSSVDSVAFDSRGDPERPRILVGSESPHWGPSVFTSDDLGQTWDDPDGGAIRFPAETGAALARVWQLQPGLPSEPDVVWAGVEPAAVFRSEDGGRSFVLVEGLWNHPHRPQWVPGGGGQCLHTIVLHPSDATDATVAVSTGGVYRTSDGGATWTASNKGVAAPFLPEPDPEFGQCVHKVAMHPDRPEQLFLQNHGGVYRSDDGGATWIDIGGGLPAVFGFPVVAHPRSPGSALVFPLVADAHRAPPDARCRVYRTDDAGVTWAPMSDGLPDDASYVSVLRDAMSADDGDPAGFYVGTRAGEVYGCVDGSPWGEIARHLPDVLTVRAVVTA